MNRLWLVSWKETGAKRTRVTPYLAHAGAALAWLLRLKPYLKALSYLETIEVREWRKDDPR